jgi:RNA polymerase sigma-70 factor (ECF subfamily)
MAEKPRNETGKIVHFPGRSEAAGGGGEGREFLAGEPGGQAEAAPRTDREPGHPPREAEVAAAAEELEIEKRWLLLSRQDPEQFGRFFEKYQRPLFTYLRGRLGDHDLAEDLLAETFLEAIDSQWRFRWQGVTFGAWLFRLARRQVARHFERRAPREARHVPQEAAEVLVAEAAADPEQEEDRQLLALCVRQLEATDQDIVIWHYWGGLRLTQIAVILGQRENAVRVRLHRARRRLAGLLRAPEIRSRLSREGQQALDDLQRELLRVPDGGMGAADTRDGSGGRGSS